MASIDSLRPSLSSACTVTTPDSSTKPHDIVPRWSDAGVSLPFATVVPSNEDDIVKTIKYTQANNLKIIPANGGHGSFVPINDRTVYIDMKTFGSIDLDEEKGEVTVGGGCLTGPVMKTLAEKGWYTATSNSNAVGIVGSLLGGLNHATLGLHGIGVDLIRSITIIPFSAPGGHEHRPLLLNSHSVGEEKKLFNALRGAGHGLGIITSITLAAHRISTLSLTDNRIWTRRLIFPPPALPTAISTYLSFTPFPPELTLVLGFLRAPPTAPIPGAPMIMLGLTYFGPSSSAEKLTAVTFEEEVVNKAVMATTAMVEWASMNDGFEPMNRHGGFKEYHSAWVKSLEAESVQKAYQSWLEFNNANMKARGGSYVVIGASNTTALSKNAAMGDETFFSPRDRGIFVQASPWYADADDMTDADAFGKSIVAALREKDDSEGRKSWGFGNNWYVGQSASEVYSDEQIEETKRVKRVWDEKNVGWSPIANGWNL